MTTAAWVSKIIKNELKAKFPTTKFSVHSQNYSGGDSVRVSYYRGSNAPTCKDVEAITNKFQAGHFDGMTDCYEYSNKTEGPTVRYVFVNEEYPKAVTDAVKARLGWAGSPEQWRRALETELVAQGY